MEARRGMARIGIISDTHGFLPVEAFNALVDCEHIIHAGDICSPEIFHDLQALAPVTAVLGNNDFNEYGSSVRRFAHPVIDGVRFLVAHYPQDVRITFAGSSALAPGDPLPNVCIHASGGFAVVPRVADQTPRGLPAMRGEDRRVGGSHLARLGRADLARLSLRCGRAAPRFRVRPAVSALPGLGQGSGDLSQSWDRGIREKATRRIKGAGRRDRAIKPACFMQKPG